MMSRNTHPQTGFTLVELVVVVGIIGLLTAATTLILNGQRVRAREARRISDIQSISDAVQQYMALGNQAPQTGGSWIIPSNGSYLNVLITSGLISKIPTEPIRPGNSCLHYLYQAPGEQLNNGTYTPDYLVTFYSEIVKTTGTHPMNDNLSVPLAPTPGSTCAGYYQVYLIPTVSKN